MTTSAKKPIWRIAGMFVLVVSICSQTFGSPVSAESNGRSGRKVCGRFTIEAELVKEGVDWESSYRGEAIFSYGYGRTETTQVTIYPGSLTPLPQSDGTQLAAQTNYYVFEDGSSVVGQTRQL